jgi:hypothetical protein
MPKRKDETPPDGYPERIYAGRVLDTRAYYFVGVAPITGDGVYRHEGQTGEVRHALLTNPNASARQLQAFRRAS